MWFTLIMFVVSFVLSTVLAPKPAFENARASLLGDFRFPRSNEGDPVPFVYGTVRLRAPNTLWYGDFEAIALTEKLKTGIFSSKRITYAHMYMMTLDLGLCLGDNVQLLRIWAGKELVWDGVLESGMFGSITHPNLFGGPRERGGLQGSFSFYPGSFSQVQSTQLKNVLDPNVPRYGGVSHIVFHHFYFGTTSSVPALNFELRRLSNGLGLGAKAVIGGADLNPMEILYDLLTQKWGRLGVNPNALDLDNLRAVGNQLYDEGIGMSLLVQRANTGKDLLEEILRLADGVAYQDPITGKIKVKLIRDDYDVDTLPVFDQDNVLSIQNFSKSTWAETHNQVRVKFTSRSKGYVESAAVAQDFANINFQQRVKSADISLPGCYDAELANRLAARTLAMTSVPLFKLQMVCNREAASLRPGDVFILNWGPYRLNQLVMRVTRLSLGELANGRVVVDALQDQFAASTAVFAAPADTSWEPIDMTPHAIVEQRVMEAPYRFLADVRPTYSGILVFARRPASSSVGFDAVPSTDGWTTEGNGLTQAQYTPSGKLTAPLAADAGFATGLYSGSITLDNVQSPSEFQSVVSLEDIQTGAANLLVIGDEILAFMNVVHNANGTVTLTGVYRALLDTQYEAHAAGATAYLLRTYDTALTDQFVGTSTVGVKLLDRTALQIQSIGSVAATNIPLNRRADRPLPPRNLRLNGSRTPPATVAASTVVATWEAQNRLLPRIYFETDASPAGEEGIQHRLEYRFNGAGGWSTVASAASPYNIPVTGMTGFLEVRVFSRVGAAGVSSWTGALMSITLT